MKNKITKLFLVLMFSGFAANAQTAEERQQIIKDYDLEKLKSLEKQFNEKYKENYAKALKIAREKGLPIEGVDSEGRRFTLEGVIEGTDELKYYKSSNNTPTKSSIQTARVQHLHNGGSLVLNIEGQTMILGIWDGGAVYAGHNSLGVSRVTSKDGSSTIDDHASHVAGTMAANNSISDIKGMAPQASLWSNNWSNDKAEMTSQASQGLLVSNHSYGTDYDAAGFKNNPGVFGRYIQDARELDLLLFTADNYLPVIAAGNARGDGYNTARGGADLMHGDAVSKNAVVVAAIEGITDYAQPSDAVMSSFSQWGPTDDYRIKPDISAKGVAVKSVGIKNANATATQQGTSMAAPSVTGVFGLWQQYYKQLYPTKIKMRAATVKALMAISADEAGTADGPDHRFGWGVINAERGAEILRDSKGDDAKTIVTEQVLNNGQTYEITFDTDGTQPLKAAIAWTDPAGNVVSSTDSPNPVLVNDLDLRIIRPNGQEVLPWALNKSWSNLFAAKADNNVDPVEVVEYKGVASGVAPAGTYTIRVTHKGTLTNGSQKFSLIVYGKTGDVSVENKTFDNLNVYPNPTNDVLNISADLASIANAKAQIFDMNGKKVYDNTDLFYNTNTASIDMSNLNTGIYVLKLTTDTVSQSIKVVKK